MEEFSARQLFAVPSFDLEVEEPAYNPKVLRDPPPSVFLRKENGYIIILIIKIKQAKLV